MAAERVKVLFDNRSDNEKYAASHCTVQAYNFNQTSDAYGNFATRPYIVATINTGAERIITGFSVTFDLANWIYATNCTFTYRYTDNSVAYDTQTPESPQVRSDMTISRYCRSVTVEIASINRPFSQLTYTGLLFGDVLQFEPGNLFDLTINQSCDLSGITAPYHTLTGTFYSPEQPLSSQVWQGKPIIVSTNLKSIGTYYIQDVQKQSKGIYKITAVSALGILASLPYLGYDAQGGVPTTTILSNIINGLITVDGSWIYGDEQYTWGVIMEGGDRREALATLALGHIKYVDENGNFKSIDTSSPVINLSTTTIKDTRIYYGPKVETLESVKKLLIYNYDDDTDFGDPYRTYNIAGETKIVVERNVGTFTKTGTKDVTIQCFCAATVGQLSQAHWDSICTNLKNFYARRRIWHGKILWNTATSEGKCGTRVTVPCDDGSTITGNVISSVLRFSGVSVSAEIQVLEAGTW